MITDFDDKIWLASWFLKSFHLSFYTQFIRDPCWIICLKKTWIYLIVPLLLDPYGSRRWTLNTFCTFLMIDTWFALARFKLVLTWLYFERDLLCSIKFLVLFVSFWIRAQKTSILWFLSFAQLTSLFFQWNILCAINPFFSWFNSTCFVLCLWSYE